MLFLPNIQWNFISVRKVAVEDVAKFESRAAKIIDKRGNTILLAEKVGDLFLYTKKKITLFCANTKTDMSEVTYEMA